MLRDVRLFKPVEYHKAFSMVRKMVPSTLQHTVPILVLATPKRPFSNASRRSSATLMSMEQLSSSNVQRGPSSLASLPSSKSLQYETNSRCLLPAGPNVTRRHRHSNSNLNCTARDHPQHPMLQALLLPHRLQDLPIHDLYNYWLISCSFSAAHPLNVPVLTHNRHRFNCKDKRRPMRHRRNHNTIKANHKANPRLRRHHHRLSPTPPPHPRHLLLLMLILPRQVQQVCSHTPCHCGLVSFSSSAVHLSRMQTVTNTASSGRLSHL
ncbi:hypothetical protein P692DRAFT_20903101 [Suillus brevipes Sb2]|nr:hypothetical protein P692DRAFT_20903101 [Suillus brevipes Sb2]